MKNIIIDGKKFNIFDYNNLESLVDFEFEGKDLSTNDYTNEDRSGRY